MSFSNFGFSGGGFSGGGFGRTVQTAPRQLGSAQAVGVKDYGDVWASYQCPSCNTAITEMQTLLISTAAKLGMSVSTTADGKVGAGTVGALQRVAQAAVSKGIVQAGPLTAFGSAEQVAKNADVIRNILGQVNSALGTGVTSVPTSASVNPSIPNIQPAPYDMSLPSSPEKKTSRLPYYIGGAIIATGLVAAIAILMSTPGKVSGRMLPANEG